MDKKSEIDKTSAEPLKISRRNLLKAGGVLGLGVVANRASQFLKDHLEGQTGNKLAQTGEIASDESINLAKTAFGEVFGSVKDKEKEEANSLVKKMKDEVLYPHPDFNDMLVVTNTFGAQIRKAAEKFGIPFDIASGIVFIENGGGVDKISSEGALGPAQLLPNTARQYGLRVDEIVDERVDPDKCFEAMCNYLADLRERFGGELGIAVWGYHAGEGNVYGALRAYFQDTEGVDLGDIITDSYDEAMQIAQNYRQKIKQTKLNIHRLFSNSAARQEILVNLGLGDETELYVYKAVAGAEIIREESRPF